MTVRWIIAWIVFQLVLIGGSTWHLVRWKRRLDRGDYDQEAS